MWAPRLSRLSIGIAWLVSSASVSAQEGPESQQTRVRIRRPAEAAAVHEAIVGARRRLDDSACRMIFTDFSDSSGRSLQDVLDASGWSAGEYLGLIGFYDGLGDRRCAKVGIAAFTSPGSRNVFICPGFRSEWRSDRRYAEIVILHEALHSLGLGENPPSSREITAHVARRCSASPGKRPAVAAVGLPGPAVAN